MAPKKIPKSRIFQHFVNLPEARRTELLRRHFSSEAISSWGRDKFDVAMYKLRSIPEQEARKALKPFKDSYASMIKAAKQNTGAFTDTILNKFGARSTDEDRVYALITSNTMQSRLDILWKGVDAKGRKPFEDQALAGMTNQKVLGTLFENPENFAKGKSLNSFLEDVQKTMDLSKEKNTIDYLREGAPQTDPDRAEKFRRAAQMYMVQPETSVDPADVAQKLQGKNWRKDVDALKILSQKAKSSYIDPAETLGRIKTAMAEIPETEEEKELFKAAALEFCKNVQRGFGQSTLDSEKGREFLRYTEQLQTEITAKALKEKPVQEIRDSLAGEFATLEKEKSGWFLSKTNTAEYNTMMKHLRLFNAKLDLMNTGRTDVELTEAEQKIVKETDAATLLDNARMGCYNYGCLKTKYGKSSIWHEAGTARLDASMKTLSKLGELGEKLELSGSASALQYKTQMDVMKNRGNSDWLKKNAVDAAAKMILTQGMSKKTLPEQKGRLEGAALDAELAKVKSSAAFQKIVNTMKPEALADAVIRGMDGLAAAYGKAAKAAQAEGSQRTASEIDPEALKPEPHHGGPGLAP